MTGCMIEDVFNVSKGGHGGLMVKQWIRNLQAVGSLHNRNPVSNLQQADWVTRPTQPHMPTGKQN